MPAGPEGEEGVGGMVADLRFNGHHLGPLQQFLLRHHPRPEPLADPRAAGEGSQTPTNSQSGDFSASSSFAGPCE